MKVTGKFSEFPLPELLQFLDRHQVTGCLSLNIFSNYYAELKPQLYIIWLNEGHLVSAYQACHQQDIYALSVQQEWISLFVARKLKERMPQGTAAGLYLEAQGAVSFEQLRSLFFGEVVHRVAALCDAKNAVFNFQSTVELPMNKMTGLRMPAARVAEQGMRGCRIICKQDLKSSNDLKDTLPDPECQISLHQPHINCYN